MPGVPDSHLMARLEITTFFYNFSARLNLRVVSESQGIWNCTLKISNTYHKKTQPLARIGFQSQMPSKFNQKVLYNPISEKFRKSKWGQF